MVDRAGPPCMSHQGRGHCNGLVAAPTRVAAPHQREELHGTAVLRQYRKVESGSRASEGPGGTLCHLRRAQNPAGSVQASGLEQAVGRYTC